MTNIVKVEVFAKMSNGERQMELLLNMLGLPENEVERVHGATWTKFEWEADKADDLCEFINECTVLSANVGAS